MAKKRKAKIRCLNCDAKLKARDVACRKCGRMRPGSFQARAGAAKAITVFRPVGGAPFIAKSVRPRCPRCTAANNASARHCTSCGCVMLAVVKSAGDVKRDSMMARFYRENSPTYADEAWYLAHPECRDENGNGGRAS